MGRHISYLKYVLRHKWYVFLECCKVGEIWRGIMHDMSKLMPDEWIAYANYFYNTDGSRRTKHTPELVAAFNKAWLKHQHRNPHHWQHWILREDAGTTIIFDIPQTYLKEMVCDWRGAGKAITGKDDITSWYSASKYTMQLAPVTRKQVEEILSGTTKNPV